MHAGNSESTQINQLSHIAIERAADGILWLDADGRVRKANEAACRLLGYTRAELLSMGVPDIDPRCPLDVYKNKYWRMN